MMDVESVPDGWKGTPLIFYSSPGTLASLACSKVALICWSYEIRGLYPNEASSLDREWFVEHDFSCIDVYKTALPSSIVEKIDKDIEIFGVELKNFTYILHDPHSLNDLGDSSESSDSDDSIDSSYFNNSDGPNDSGYNNDSHGYNDSYDSYNIFNFNVHDFILRCIDHIVVESNGVISREKTARSLLDGDTLNSYEKYVIACNYCLESDVERLWSSVSSDPVQRIRNCGMNIMHYWNCRMSNKPYRGRLEFRLLKKYVYQSWTITEYFWNRLRPQLQSRLLSQRYYWYIFFDNIIYLLPKLSTSELAVFLRKFHTDIVIELTSEKSCRYAMQIWDYLLLNGEITHTVFYNMLTRLCDNYAQDKSFNMHRGILLQYIWNTAPDNLKKKLFLKNHVFICFQNMLLRVNYLALFKAYGFNMDFLLDLLAYTEFERRSDLFRFNWRKFIVFAAASDLKKIMELCLPEDDIAEFEKRMVDYQTLKPEFDLFIANGRCLELENYLKLFCSSEAEEKLVKIQIVDSNMSRMFQFDSEKLKKFNDFIDNAFSSASLANKRKEEYFQENLATMCDLFDRGLLIKIKNILHFLLSHNPQFLAEMKQIFLTHCRDILISGSVAEFKILHWQEFIKWCTSTEDEYFKFMNSLPIDQIFEALLIKVIERSRQNSSLGIKKESAPMSNFLRWYFNDREEGKRFLSRKLAHFKRLDHSSVAYKMLNRVFLSPSSVAYKTLAWFFEADEKHWWKFSETLRVENGV